MRNGFGNEKHVNLAASVDHKDYPEGTGYFDYVRGQLNLIAFVCEPNPNGPGCKVIEVRDVDLKGSMPYQVVKNVSWYVPSMNFTVMKDIIGKKVAGLPLY